MARRILLVSYLAPSRGHAGGLRLLDLYSQIKKQSPDIELHLLTCSNKGLDWQLNELDSLFDKICWLSAEQFNKNFVKNCDVFHGDYDVIDFQYHQSGRLIKEFRKHHLHAMIVFGPMESQVRAAFILMLQFWASRGVKKLLTSIFLACQEMIYCFYANRVISVSKADQKFLRTWTRKSKVVCVPTCISPHEFELAFRGSPDRKSTQKKKIVYLAYFGSETNRAALRWYCEFVHPRVLKANPDYVIDIIGRGIDTSLREECQIDGVNIVGEVIDVAGVIQSAIAGIAPALSGAGVRGKIHQYAIAGVPCISSSIGWESLSYQSERDILIADTASEFVEACNKFLNDPTLARQVGENARIICLKDYVWDAQDVKIESLYLK